MEDSIVLMSSLVNKSHIIIIIRIRLYKTNVI